MTSCAFANHLPWMVYLFEGIHEKILETTFVSGTVITSHTPVYWTGRQNAAVGRKRGTKDRVLMILIFIIN